MLIDSEQSLPQLVRPVAGALERYPEQGARDSHLDAMILAVLNVALSRVDHLVVDAQQLVEQWVRIRFALNNKINITIPFPAARKEIIVLVDQISVLDAVRGTK